MLGVLHFILTGMLLMFSGFMLYLGKPLFSIGPMGMAIGTFMMGYAQWIKR